MRKKKYIKKKIIFKTICKPWYASLNALIQLSSKVFDDSLQMTNSVTTLL